MGCEIVVLGCENILYCSAQMSLTGELYAQRLQKLNYLYLFTNRFMKISP